MEADGLPPPLRQTRKIDLNFIQFNKRRLLWGACSSWPLEGFRSEVAGTSPWWKHEKSADKSGSRLPWHHFLIQGHLTFELFYWYFSAGQRHGMSIMPSSSHRDSFWWLIGRWCYRWWSKQKTQDKRRKQSSWELSYQEMNTVPFLIGQERWQK